MRYPRLRWRSLIFLGLIILTFFSLLTLHTFIWSANEFEQQHKQFPHRPKLPDAIPFWSALDHQNIYELKSIPSDKNKQSHSRRPLITAARINELFQLVRQTRDEQINSFDKIKSYSFNSTWNFEKFLEQKARMNTNETPVDTAADSVGNNVKHGHNSTTTAKTVDEHDKIQLRNFIHSKLVKWKETHQNDKIISLADLMYDTLAQDEPGYVVSFISKSKRVFI
jgi:hypothetical protein